MNRNSPRFPGRAGTNNGFTLLEVLVALVLIGFLLVMLYGSLYAGARNWRDSEVRVRENDDKRLVLQFIRRVMGETMPMFLAGRQDTRVMFLGDNASLQFVSRLPAHHAGSGIYILKLETGHDELLLSYTSLTRGKAMFDEDIFVEAEQISLLGDIRTIDLDYFGRKTADAEPAWHDEWESRYLLPGLIRLRISPSEPGPWPPLVIAVRARAAQGLPQLTLHLEEADASG